MLSAGERIAMCMGKFKFANGCVAHRFLRDLRRRNRKNTQSAYRCGVCGSWHIGNHDKRTISAKDDLE